VECWACNKARSRRFRLAAADQLTADDNPAFGKADFFPDLRVITSHPARRRAGVNELGADVTFADGVLVHVVRWAPADRPIPRPCLLPSIFGLRAPLAVRMPAFACLWPQSIS
jgi:hypothetical protein